MKIATVVGLAALSVAVVGCNDKASEGKGADTAAKAATVAGAALDKAANPKAACTEPGCNDCAAPTFKKGDPKEVLVTVGDKKLLRGEVDADFEQLLKVQGGNVPAEQVEMYQKRFLQQRARMFMDLTVITDAAAAKGITFTEADRKAKVDEIIKQYAGRPNAPKSLDDLLKGHPFGAERARKEFDQQMLAQKLIEQEVVNKIKVDPKIVEAELKKQLDQAAEAAKKAIDAEAEIKKIHAELKTLKGEALTKKFAEVAKEKSACPSSAKGGDLGPFSRGQMVPEFDKVAFSSEVGVVSEPVKTQFGWHVLMVTKKIPAVAAKDGKVEEPEKVQASHILIKAEKAPKAPTKEDVEKMLKGRETQQAVMTYLENLRKAAKITAPGCPDLLPKAEAPKAPAAKPAPKAVESKPVAVPPAPAKK